AILRYHDPKNWPQIREALKKMGLARLIGNSPKQLVPPETRDELKRNKGKGFQARGGQRALTKNTPAQFKPQKKTSRGKQPA
ncbi:MAG: DUF3362 domain-containing protein, partial [Psychrosphaera sp.]|nr:DUF3362 domain-containing protein [Psychrosphaera sp.]